jgi:hypothetical protein
MGRRVDTQELEARLFSGNLGVQVAALKEARRTIEDISKAAVQGFGHTSNPLIYADALSALGQAIVPHVEELYDSYEKGESRTALAIMLLFLGNRAGVSDALGALSMENSNHLLAASKLANAGIREAVEPLTRLLRAYAFNEPMDNTYGPKIGTLIDSLTKLGVDIPSDIKERLTAPGVPRRVTVHVQKGELKCVKK